jgi:hypothetical protein
VRALLAGEAPQAILAGSNTTIGVIATDAPLTKARPSAWPAPATTDWRAPSPRCTP